MTTRAQGTWSEARFRKQHGISAVVWQRRGYLRYRSGSPGVEDLLAIDPGYGVLAKQALRHRTRHPGLAIPRRSLPETVGPKPLAELRPDRPILMARRSHRHRDGDLTHDHSPLWPFRAGGSVGTQHSHETVAKYIFAPSKPVEYLTPTPAVSGATFWKALEESERIAEALSDALGFDLEVPRRRDALERLLKRELPPRPRMRMGAKSGPKTRVSLSSILVKGHELLLSSELNRSRVSEARRIDIHPTALELLPASHRVFFVLEGCIKADAILTSILESGDLATVVSVPSVTLWPKDWARSEGDLLTFARLASEKEVVIVVDSDWSDYARNRGSVYSQAARLQDRLVWAGLHRVAIAAPTAEPASCEMHGGEAGSKRGVDDYLADGRHLGSLEVIGPRNTEPLLNALRESAPRSAAGLGAVLLAGHQLALRSRPNTGTAYASNMSLARILGEDLEGNFARPSRARQRQASRVSRALQNAGIGIQVQGDELGRSYQFPLALLPPPQVLGTLEDTGVQRLPRPDLRPRTVCAECGQPLEGSVRRTARLHPACAHRLRSRTYRARKRDA